MHRDFGLTLYILDFHDRRKALTVIETLWHHLPFPKSRKK